MTWKDADNGDRHTLTAKKVKYGGCTIAVEIADRFMHNEWYGCDVLEIPISVLPALIKKLQGLL